MFKWLYVRDPWTVMFHGFSLYLRGAICLGSALYFFSEALYAQGTILDYKRAESLNTLYRNKIYNDPHSFHWIGNTHKFWYVNSSPDNGKEFLMVDADGKIKSNAFDHKKLAAGLSRFLKKTIDPKSLPFNDVEFSEDLKSINVIVDSAKIICTLSSYVCSLKEVIPGSVDNGNYYWGNAFDEKSNGRVKSPDGTRSAYIKDGNVFVSDKDGSSDQLSFDGNDGEYYSTFMQWSPDGKKLMAYKVQPGFRRTIHFVESSPKDQLQPRLHTREYQKPGDALPQRRPQLFLVDEKQHVRIDDNLFRNQYFVEDIRWSKDSKSFSFEFNERGHQRYRIIQVLVPSGEVKVVVDETSNTFIDYSGKRFRYDLQNTNEIIWASERDGWNHLYLCDVASGKVKNQITRGSWLVREVVKVNEGERSLIFVAYGLDPDQDPYLAQYCKVNFDGTGFTRLTSPGTDHKLAFSTDYKFFVDYQSRVDLPSSCRLFQTGQEKTLMELQTADISRLLKEGWKMPEVFKAKGRDGKTDIWGVVIRPSVIDPARKYPVVEMVYAGPQDYYVPKSFGPGYLGLYSLAELGFIVVQVDGMGTSWRSKAFHDVCYKNLKDAGFPDRIGWIKQLARTYPYVDSTRVGIFGGSAGGQNAAGALLFHNDFYTAAVASCGSHDNRVDKMWWNEQWMGYPIGPHYQESSNVTNAHKLKGHLMLMVGEVDDNVDPASTMQVADALIKANKDFELVVLPGVNHTGGGQYGERKRRDFFVRHLLKVNPPAWDEVYENAEKVAVGSR